MPSEISQTHIAQISDLHLALGMPLGAEWLGKRGLSGLSWARRRRHWHRLEVAEALLADMVSARADAVAMTGDMVNFGLEKEFAASRPWLDRLGPPEQVLAIPGNHEAVVRGWRAAMERHWGAYAEPGRTLRTGPAMLIGVSSAVVTPPFMATGRVGTAGLATLTDQLAKARAAGLLPVVLIHHPPTPITIRRKGLTDGAALAKALAAGGASLVLHGHTHRRDLSWIDAPHGRIPVLGVPALSMRPGGRFPAGAWRMIRIACSDGIAQAQIADREITPQMDVRARTPFLLSLPMLARDPATASVLSGPSAARGARA